MILSKMNGWKSPQRKIEPTVGHNGAWYRVSVSWKLTRVFRKIIPKTKLHLRSSLASSEQHEYYIMSDIDIHATYLHNDDNYYFYHKKYVFFFPEMRRV